MLLLWEVLADSIHSVNRIHVVAERTRPCLLMKTVDQLFDEAGLAIEDVADKTGLASERVNAIAVGRWTPSPAERATIAAAFNVPVDQVSWGHTLDPRNLRYRRFGLKKDFQP